MDNKQNDKNTKKEDPPKDAKDKETKKDDKTNNQEEKEKGTSIITMPKGDYTVHVSRNFLSLSNFFKNFLKMSENHLNMFL
jgi:hypothetical protein